VIIGKTINQSTFGTLTINSFNTSINLGEVPTNIYFRLGGNLIVGSSI